jgi:GNAT superfamily N-acetyltransferase
MSWDIQFDCTSVDWSVVSETLRLVGMAYSEPSLHRKAFENSYVTVFIYQDSRLIGFGRAISDGAYQAAVYDIAVIPECQGKGVGTLIMESILAKVSHCNVILYASIGKEAFYQTLGFRKMKTGMALFRKAEIMAEKGFTD